MLVGTVAGVAVQSAYAAGQGWSHVFSWSGFRHELGTRFGHAELGRWATLVVAAVLLEQLDRVTDRTGAGPPRWWTAAWLAIVAALVTVTTLGGDAARRSLGGARGSADLVHVAAATLGLGALCLLGAFALARGSRPQGPDHDAGPSEAPAPLGGATPGPLGAAARRLVGLAAVASLLVVASGVALSVCQVGSFGALTSSAYGRLLLVKGGCVVALVAAVVVLLLRRRAAGPIIRRRTGGPGRGGVHPATDGRERCPRPWSPPVRTPGGEPRRRLALALPLALATATVGLTAALTPSEPPVVAAGQADQPFGQAFPIDGGNLPDSNLPEGLQPAGLQPDRHHRPGAGQRHQRVPHLHARAGPARPVDVLQLQATMAYRARRSDRSRSPSSTPVSRTSWPSTSTCRSPAPGSSPSPSTRAATARWWPPRCEPADRAGGRCGSTGLPAVGTPPEGGSTTHVEAPTFDRAVHDP